MSSTVTALQTPGRLRTYASFVRFEHTLFSLPLILAGVFSARGPALSWQRWVLIAVAAVGARTAAMALNRIIDRRLDALNPRTQSRELPSGKMKTGEAWALLLASTAAYLGACAALGRWFLMVSPIPLAVFALYPYLKRFTPLCHFGVGFALALAPLAGFAAAHPDLQSSWAAWWLAAFALLWVTGFDIIYATLDEEFDRSQGVHSAVAWLGRAGALGLSRVLHIAAIMVLTFLLIRLGHLERTTFWAVVTGVLTTGVSALLWLEQSWAENVNLAFFKVNVWVGFGVLAAVLAARMATGGF